MQKIEIDGHTFRVPEKHVMEGSIPWLPQSQSSGLRFIVNPDAPMGERILVGIEPTAVRCDAAQTLSKSTQLGAACWAATHEGAVIGQQSALEKVHHNEDPTQWEYRSKNAPEHGGGTVVASCYATADGKSGSCTALGNYQDLVYSVILRDSDIGRLPEIQKKIADLLSNWEG